MAADAGVVQSLNMHKGLFTALTRALEQAEGKPSALRGVEMGSKLSACAQQAELPSALSAEGLLVGKMLKRDFEKNGNHLCETDQQHLAELTDQSLRLGMAFGKSPNVQCTAQIFTCMSVSQNFLFHTEMLCDESTSQRCLSLCSRRQSAESNSIELDSHQQQRRRAAPRVPAVSSAATSRLSHSAATPRIRRRAQHRAALRTGL